MKTIYRTTAHGRPRTRDRHFDPDATLVEERVVILRAPSFAQAIRAAEREARAYARGERKNLYGQRVVTRYLGECDAFELFEAPRDGREVYSRTELVERRLRDRQVGDRLLGATENRRAHATRRKFLDATLTPKTWPDGEAR